MVIFSDNFDQHLTHLEKLLKSATDCGLKFSVKKCRFGYEELKVLGYSLSRYGMRTLADRVMPITELQAPKTSGRSR